MQEAQRQTILEVATHIVGVVRAVVVDEKEFPGQPGRHFQTREAIQRSAQHRGAVPGADGD